MLPKNCPRKRHIHTNQPDQALLSLKQIQIADFQIVIPNAARDNSVKRHIRVEDKD
jgi:hypothetical protein